MKVSQAVKVKNEELDHFGRAGAVVGPGESDAEVVVLIDGEAEPMAFAVTDLEQLG